MHNGELSQTFEYSSVMEANKINIRPGYKENGRMIFSSWWDVQGSA